MKNYKLLSRLFSCVLCLCLILTMTACNNKESASSEEMEIVYEYIEESALAESDETSKDSDKSDKNSKPDEDKSDKEQSETGASKSESSKDKNEASKPDNSKDKEDGKTESSKSDSSKDKEESKPEVSKPSNSTDNNSTNSENKDNSSNSQTPEKAVYKSSSELSEADPPINTIVTLDIEPYAKGKYKIVNGSYLENNSSIIYVSSGKFAIRYVEKLNAWRDSIPKGSFVAHQGFNGWIDKSYLGGGETSNGTYPSNTKEAVDHAVRLGYKFIEIDITTTKDKVWVVQHDANSKELLTDLSKESKPFTTMLSAVITKLQIRRKWKGGGYWEFSDKIKKEYVPTLEDVLKYAQNKDIYLILDNKSLSHHDFTDEEYDILADLINKYNMGARCAAYASCLKPLTNRIHGMIACYSSLPIDDEEAAYNIMSSYGNFMLSASLTQYKDYLPFAKKYNVPIAVWVVDDYKTADSIFADGVDYILTNYCLPKNANFGDYKNIKSFGLANFSSENRTDAATVTYAADTVNVTAKGEGAAQLTLGYKDLGLKTGDIISLSADCNLGSGEAFIKIASDDAVLEAKRIIKDKNTVYYVVNDDNGVNLTANLGVNNGSATFKNVKIQILRETARGEK